MDLLLYGHNPEERIVAAQQLNDQTIRLFKRMEGGKIVHRDVEFFPFFFLANDTLIKDFSKKFWLKELASDNFYRFIAAFSRWSEMWEAVHFILQQYNKNHSPRISSYQELRDILVRTDPVRQFLLQSGITLFKGMRFDELIRLYIDVQFAPAKAKKRSVKSTEEQILVITLVTSKEDEYVLKKNKQNEQAILNQCIQYINEIDPDVIEGYDLFGTILPAVSRACERQQIPFTVGRDGSDMRTPTGVSSPGFGESEWFSFDIFGRHLVDTLTMAEAEINTKRSEHPFSLNSIAKYFGVPLGIEQSISQNRIIEEWDQEPARVVNQSLQNTRITRDLGNLFLPSIFYLAQMCPFNFKMLIHTGSSARVESLILREYVRQKYSVSKPSEGSRNINIPAEIFHIGIFSDVFYIELEGLYPSIILHNKIKPKTDSIDVFLPLLSGLYSLPLVTPNKNHSGKIPDSKPDTQIKTLKQLLDSFHLYLGSAKGLFNDPEQAELIIAESLNILKEIMHQIELFNVTVIQSDGQGFFLLMPDNIIGEENRKIFVERLSNTLPEGIHLVQSHHYQKMLSYRKSNYAVLDHNNNVFIKGNGLISRGIEHYLRVFAQRFIECLLTHDLKRLHHTYATAYTQITEHKWTPLDFCKTDFARMDTETYQNEVAEGRIAPFPAMEAAVRSSLFVKQNTRISYYITGAEADVNIARSTRLAEEWNAGLPDENTVYYLTRLRETANKFHEFFEPTAFERILSLDEMFGFSDEGIRILVRRAASETAETKPVADDYGIWLAETE
jgi:DNA polymerase elongation subunit (family B)